MKGPVHDNKIIDYCDQSKLSTKDSCSGQQQRLEPDQGTNSVNGSRRESPAPYDYPMPPARTVNRVSIVRTDPKIGVSPHY